MARAVISSRPELAPRGIGVSVLCPGFVRTHITSSGRNLPQRFVGAVGHASNLRTDGRADQDDSRARRAGGDPGYFGELVREAVENDWPYIFTDTDFEPVIGARFAAIRKDFDQSRGRTPRR
jgi:NAD(P)-dependent dehydrogenase (short-subunit alcohol dehydrogenase family)